MNNYELFNFENINNKINNYLDLEEKETKQKELYNKLSNIKPIDTVPDKLYRDDFMEQDIEIDLNSSDFRKIFNDYNLMYNEKKAGKSIVINKPQVELKDVNYEIKLEELNFKKEELYNYLSALKDEKKQINDKQQLLELTQKELQQERELLDIEKDNFEQYKKTEEEKIKKDKMNFQNMIEEMKNKIETILN